MALRVWNLERTPKSHHDGATGIVLSLNIEISAFIKLDETQLSPQ